jgi:hypothetical protein
MYKGVENVVLARNEKEAKTINLEKHSSLVVNK